MVKAALSALELIGGVALLGALFWGLFRKPVASRDRYVSEPVPPPRPEAHDTNHDPALLDWHGMIDYASHDAFIGWYGTCQICGTHNHEDRHQPEPTRHCIHCTCSACAGLRAAADTA